MPIQIKELHIYVAVDSSQNEQVPGNQTANGGGSGGPTGEDATQTIVAECVEQVLQILQHKMER